MDKTQFQTKQRSSEEPKPSTCMGPTGFMPSTNDDFKSQREQFTSSPTLRFEKEGKPENLIPETRKKSSSLLNKQSNASSGTFSPRSPALNPAKPFSFSRLVKTDDEKAWVYLDEKAMVQGTHSLPNSSHDLLWMGMHTIEGNSLDWPLIQRSWRLSSLFPFEIPFESVLGPFTTQEMDSWFVNSFLPLDLLVGLNDMRRFIKLSDFIEFYEKKNKRAAKKEPKPSFSLQESSENIQEKAKVLSFFFFKGSDLSNAF